VSGHGHGKVLHVKPTICGPASKHVLHSTNFGLERRSLTSNSIATCHSSALAYYTRMCVSLLPDEAKFLFVGYRMMFCSPKRFSHAQTHTMFKAIPRWVCSVGQGVSSDPARQVKRLAQCWSLTGVALHASCTCRSESGKRVPVQSSVCVNRPGRFR
jgi:hypothetical protein